MAVEVKYKYTDLFDEARHRTEMESLTIPQSAEGVPGNDVRNVVGVMEDTDSVFARNTLARGASYIYPSVRIALDKDQGLLIQEEGAENGVVFNFTTNRIKANDLVVLGVNLKTALLYFVLFEWFTMFPSRSDIAQKYNALYEKAINGIKRSIIQ